MEIAIDREKIISDFDNFFKEHSEQIMKTVITAEELAQDPDFLEDESWEDYYELEAVKNEHV